MKLWNFIREAMMSHPTQKIREERAEMSFEEVAVFAREFSERLRGFRCCAILCSSEMAAAMALLSCFAAEVTALPLSMRYGQAHCRKILDAVSPDAIISDNGGELAVYRLDPGSYSPPDVHPALIMCTSGTTGKPKGAMLSESNILANVTDIAGYFALGESDTILIARPLYHCAVLTGEFLTALVRGAGIRFYSGNFNPPKMPELIRNYQITAFCGTPTLLSMMARFSRGTPPPSLKHIVISGECMGADTGIAIADAFPQSRIYHVYGLTEACPRVSYLPPEAFRQYPDCVGIPLRSVSVRLLTPDGALCQPGEEGVLWVRGDNVMLGYYRDPGRTAEILRDGWLCTGDLAVKNDAGYLKIKGRNDDLIIKSGMNVYPAEIEAAMKQDARVREVLAYKVEGRFGVQIGMKLAGDFSSVEEVKKLCAQLLPPFQIPAVITLADELPKNGSGKIIRRERHDA